MLIVNRGTIEVRTEGILRETIKWFTMVTVVSWESRTKKFFLATTTNDRLQTYPEIILYAKTSLNVLISWYLSI